LDISYGTSLSGKENSDESIKFKTTKQTCKNIMKKWKINSGTRIPIIEEKKTLTTKDILERAFTVFRNRK
jgi:hypothetical protein